ncbi:two-component regulator propeller domain-containing protein [Dysgonomonas sp. 511]|uniref:hybrid sensor histidine kinase/response regulator transcription factor n=1 Tax=Dysgonomonas sp. 511 TaxID=2302930 RepID=UPI0013D759CD|nr:two-component regulator propeller domain-containing protein [Dysgonomonas sp. 511]NDV77975.1 response regulator [Dysgonomonas sp. 511]
MKLRIFSYFSIIILCSVLSLQGQQRYFFEHYGPEDGLPQHTVMSILQDNKGFIWFSTWNGLCRFDGYNFYTYRIRQGDKYHMRSNRIDFICEDAYGYIWTLPYDREPHRFDPKEEEFMGIRSLKGYEDLTFIATKILTTPSKKVWLLSDKMGAVCVTDSTFNIEIYNKGNNKINSNKINLVHEDTAQQSWILTDDGLYCVRPDGQKIESFFIEKSYVSSEPAQAFYSAMESGNTIWFGSNNGRIRIYDKQSGRVDLLQLDTKADIGHIQEIDNDEVLIATTTNGFFVYNRPTKTLKKYTASTLEDMVSDRIFSTYIDKAHNVWFELGEVGVAKFNPQTKTMKHFKMKIESTNINAFPANFFIFEDKENRLWVHPRGGGFACYDAVQDRLKPFFNEPSSPDWRFSNLMHAAFSDRQGNLWLSTRSHGLDKVTFSSEVFKTMVIDSDVHSTVNNDIRSVFEDSRKNLWVSTKGGKIFVYDSQLNQKGYIDNNGNVGYGKPLEGITYNITEDSRNNIWIATKGEGIYKLIPKGDSYQVEHYSHSQEDIYSLSHNSVYYIHEDRKRRIWVGTYGGGLNLFDEKTKRFINHRNELKSYPIQFGSQIRTMNSDKFGNICVGTTLGLIMFNPDFASASDIDYKFYTREPENSNSLSDNDVYDICTTKTGDTYFATFGGGLNKVAEVDKKGFPISFVSYTAKDGLPSDVILMLVEDDTDLRGFIVTILDPYYKVLQATNGKEGYEVALKDMPDFILSDIMMPEVDGVELLKKIRSTDATSHIPFILLTAKTDLETKVGGLDYGADDYMTKPFSVKYLRARIENIIRQRKNLYEKYTSGKTKINATPSSAKEESAELQITPQDELFIRKIKEEIERNIDNSDYVVDDLASAMAMSRTVFFKKLKSLTGLAPIEFIRDIKMKYAATLIASQQYTIKEVSFMIGISDTKYFTQCFKNVYGMTPSEYKNQTKTD